MFIQVPRLFSDMNECERSPMSCHEHAQCTNTDGSYTCTCNQGFDGDGHNCTSKPGYNNAVAALGGYLPPLLPPPPPHFPAIKRLFVKSI